jgi:superfamily II DNA or RNA helicase
MTKAEKQTKLQAHVLNIIDDQYNVSADIGTGGGKTLLGLKHMAKQYHDSIAFLVAASKKSIFEEWVKNAKEHGFEYLLEHITFTTYRSLKKQSLEYDWFYADECHSFTENNTVWLDSYTLKGGKILGLTGSYPKSGIKREICDRYCPRVFVFDVDTAIKFGMLNDYKIFVHMLKLDKKHTVKKTSKNGKRWFTSEVKDYYGLTKAIENADGYKKKMQLRIFRMKAMQSYPGKIEYVKKILKKIPKKAIVFVNTKEQADEVCKHSYHSGNKDSEKNLELFSEGLIYRISCVEQLSEGKNIKDLQVGIITHAFSNDTKTKQRIGRFLRLSPNMTAIIHILCYEDTVDKNWVRSALKSFDNNKIHIYRP